MQMRFTSENVHEGKPRVELICARRGVREVIVIEPMKP